MAVRSEVTSESENDRTLVVLQTIFTFHVRLRIKSFSQTISCFLSLIQARNLKQSSILSFKHYHHTTSQQLKKFGHIAMIICKYNRQFIKLCCLVYGV